MPLSERSRASIYQGLSTLIEPEAVGEMLSQFPTRDLDDLVTRDHLRVEMAQIRAEMAAGFAASQRWTVGTLVALAAVLIAALALFS